MIIDIVCVITVGFDVIVVKIYYENKNIFAKSVRIIRSVYVDIYSLFGIIFGSLGDDISIIIFYSFPYHHP